MFCYVCYGKNYFLKNCIRKRICKKCKRLYFILFYIEGFFFDRESGFVNKEVIDNDKLLKVNNVCVDIF